METTNTAKIVEEFTKLVDMDHDYTINELKGLMSDVYKAQMAGKKPIVKKDSDTVSVDSNKKKGRPVKIKVNKDGSVKQKKPPSAYNLYVKGKYAELKHLHPDKKAPQIMSLAAAAWKDLSDEEKNIFKQKIIEDKEAVVEDKEAVVEDEEVVVEDEEVVVDDEEAEEVLPVVKPASKKKSAPKKKSKENTFIDDDDE